MRWLLIVILLSTFLPAFGQVSYTYGAEVMGARVHFVVINPFSDGIKLTPVYVPGGISFEALVSLYRPVVAINGTFFNPKTKQPIGDIVIEGTHFIRGKLRTAFIVQGPFAIITTIPAATDFTGKLENLLACGPRLLTNGRITLYPKAEGFQDKRLFKPARRSAIGVTESGKVVMAVVVTPVTLSRVAKIMRALGCVDAMNLDGGSSSALYCAGKIFVRPKRKLSTVLMVVKTPTLQMVGLTGGKGDGR